MVSHALRLCTDHCFDLTAPFSCLICLKITPSQQDLHYARRRKYFLSLPSLLRLQKCSPKTAMRVVGHHAAGFHERTKRGGQDGKAYWAPEQSSRSMVESKHLMGKVMVQLKDKGVNCLSTAPALF